MKPRWRWISSLLEFQVTSLYRRLLSVITLPTWITMPRSRSRSPRTHRDSEVSARDGRDGVRDDHRRSSRREYDSDRDVKGQYDRGRDIKYGYEEKRRYEQRNDRHDRSDPHERSDRHRSERKEKHRSERRDRSRDHSRERDGDREAHKTREREREVYRDRDDRGLRRGSERKTREPSMSSYDDLLDLEKMGVKEIGDDDYLQVFLGYSSPAWCGARAEADDSLKSAEFKHWLKSSRGKVCLAGSLGLILIKPVFGRNVGRGSQALLPQVCQSMSGCDILTLRGYRTDSSDGTMVRSSKSITGRHLRHPIRLSEYRPMRKSPYPALAGAE